MEGVRKKELLSMAESVVVSGTTKDRRETGPLSISLIIFGKQTGSKIESLWAFLVGAMWVGSGNNVFVLMLIKEVTHTLLNSQKFKFQHILTTT